MIRIALYDRNMDEARKLRRVLGAFAGKYKVPNVGVSLGGSYDGLINIVKRMQSGYFNIALVRVSDRDDSVLEKLSKLLAVLKETTPKTEVIVLSNEPCHAYNAYEVGARFLTMPFDEQAFSSTIGKSLLHSVAVNKQPFPIKSGKSVMVMNLNDIMFAEASKRGPIIHLPESRVVPVQGTLQALQERLHALSDQFLRAGGSFIVNLDNIRTADGDSVIFSSGETIILPVRSRKTVLEAFDSFKLRA